MDSGHRLAGCRPRVFGSAGAHAPAGGTLPCSAIRKWGPGLLAGLAVADRPRHLRVRLHRLEHAGLVHELARARAPTTTTSGSTTTPSCSDDERFANDVTQPRGLHARVRRSARSSSGSCMACCWSRASAARRSSGRCSCFPMAISFIATAIIWRWLLNNATRPPDRPGSTSCSTWSASGFLRQRLAQDRLGLGHRRDRAAGGLGAVRVHHGAVPGRHARRPGRAARGGPGRRRQRAAGVLARGAADDAAGADERGGDPGPHLAEDVRPHLRASTRGAGSIDDAGALHVVHHLRRLGFYARGATIATLLLFGIAVVIVPYIWYSMRSERKHERTADRRPPRPVGDRVRRSTARSAIRSRWAPYVTTARYLVLFALVCFFLMPVYVLLVTAFKDPAEVSVVADVGAADVVVVGHVPRRCGRSCRTASSTA